jgi:hypothetical protein
MKKIRQMRLPESGLAGEQRHAQRPPLYAAEKLQS